VGRGKIDAGEKTTGKELFGAVLSVSKICEKGKVTDGNADFLLNCIEIREEILL